MASFALSLPALAVAAPDTPEPAGDVTGKAPTTLGNVTVTASKMSAASTVQDTPLAVQAIGQEDFERKAALDFSDFYHQIDGLSVQDNGPGDKRYIIRGITSNGAGTVGVYLDDVVITGSNEQDGGGQQADVKLFDLDRVEVLKGPQGTTFGSGSLAGTIRYLTAQPDLSRFSGRINSSVRATKGAELGYQSDFAINLPVVKDTFAIRIAGYGSELPGWIDSRFEQDVNGETSKAGRISALWKPSDNLSITAMAMQQSTDQDGKSYYNLTDYAGNTISGGSDYRQADLTRNPWNENTHLYNFKVEYWQPYGTFTATASRYDRQTLYSRDASYVAGLYFGLDPYSDGLSSLRQPNSRSVNTYEARFASAFDGPLQLLAGLYQQNQNREFRSVWPYADAEGNAQTDGPSLLERTLQTGLEEQAAFTELSWDVSERLNLTVGGRYYKFDLESLPRSIVGAGGGSGSGYGLKGSSSDNGFIGRFNASYKFTSDAMGYVQVAQGFRPGGVNDQTAAELANVAIPAGYSADSLVNYELGFKSSWLDERLIFNTALYYIDWSDIQVTAQATSGTTSFPYTANGGGAEVKGIEFQLQAEPVDGLTLGVSGSYSDSKLSKDNPAPSDGDKGDRLPYVPRWTASANVDYAFSLAGWSEGLEGGVGVDYSYTGARATDFNATVNTYLPLDAYSLLGAHVSVGKGPWTVTLAASNLTNEDTAINYDAVAYGATPWNVYVNRPRTFILSFSYKL
ncbi:TonB-dependent receptor [Stenotrophomonas sp. MMGLT7]|uniref:TonB-dependent receptor n=1 Tax=Stenotrophomonas sp. MMGLT7 TaxID=2901227 RepID=UPI001E45443A|nr:TonB-dependent receptor [Stenotrophomonas sp. MMGLT7]MCD7098786.1 TonB-dependent receptor [Stenotrophomonas sp. MMGLT7]